MMVWREGQRMAIGQRIPMVDATARVTGAMGFVLDLELPGMLHAAFVRSPVAHARIRSVDLSPALQAPGVALALSGAELRQALPPVRDNQLPLPARWKAANAKRERLAIRAEIGRSFDAAGKSVLQRA